MRAPLITLSKFVGTISLGLLTGVSYTLSTVAYPSLLHLPTAPTAAQTHLYLRTHARRTQRLLAALTITSLSLAFVFAPSRGRHPYLLWTSLAAALGLAGARLERGCRWLSASSAASVGHGGGAGGAGAKIGLADDEIAESAVLVADGNGSGSSAKSESGEDDTEAVNGEVVRRGVERGQAVEAFRTGFWGLGFVMAIVGIWGDGA